jgi:Kef-type K+ transport system membrane component KefB
MILLLSDPVYIFCVLLLVILISPLLATRLRIPPLISQILLGAILGTNGLGILQRDERLILLERIGLLYIMLLAGIQMDLKNFQRLGIRALVFGLMTFGIPLVLGLASGRILGYSWLAACLLGILYSPHTLMAYPIVAALGLAQQESVAVAVGGTVITTVLTLSGYAMIQATHAGTVGLWLWVKLLVILPLIMGLCFWGIPKLGRPFLEQDSEYSTVPFIFVLGCMLSVASVTHALGVDAIVGAFIAGLALNTLVPLTSPLMEQIAFVGNSLFIPAFAISVGVLSKLQGLLQDPQNLGLVALMITGAVVGKFLAAGIAGKIFQYAFSKIMVIWGLTVSRSALVLVIGLYGKSVELLPEPAFNAVIVYIMVTCLMGPIVAAKFGQAELELEQSL